MSIAPRMRALLKNDNPGSTIDWRRTVDPGFAHELHRNYLGSVLSVGAGGRGFRVSGAGYRFIS